MQVSGLRFLLPAVACALLAFGLPACEEVPRGTLEIHWSVNGETGAAACTTAGVTTVRVLTAHSGAASDPDPAHPIWPYKDFLCTDQSGRFPIKEGIYRVRIVALDAGGAVRSTIVDFQGIQVVSGQTRSIPLNPLVEAPVDLEVALCGDGAVQSGEWCDLGDLGGYDCLARGYDGGTLTCTSTCTLDESQCYRCGDGVVGPGESCDGSDLDGQSCETLGLMGGPLACAEDCTLDLTTCEGCGNGVVEAGEECDDASSEGGDGCSPDCLLESGPLRVAWTVLASDASTLSDCAGEGITQVDLSVTLSGTGTVVDATRLSCSDGLAVFPELGYGLYTLRLSGLDSSMTVVARGVSGVTDHSLPDGTGITVDLVALP